MATVALAQAKARLSELVDSAMDGEETIIAKHGRPVAKLVPYSRPKSFRYGTLKGKIKIPADFDEPLSADVLALFEGTE